MFWKRAIDADVYKRRLLVVPFVREIPKKERIAEIGKRIAQEEPDALLYWAVRGASRVVRSSTYSEPPSSVEAIQEWCRESDPVVGFLDDRGAVRFVAVDDAVPVPTRVVYDAFRSWARERGFSRLPNISHFARHVLASGRPIGSYRTARGRFLVGIALVDERLR